MKKLLVLFLLGFSLLSAEKIKIAVAANVSYAINELVSTYKKKHPQTEIQVILGSSGKLTAQIKNGAPYQLFMSANMKYPHTLYSEKIAVSKPVVYAQGALAYLSITPRDFSKGINLLKEEDIKKVAIANPKTAPYGAASVEALKNAGIYEEIREKFVYGESISQTVTYAIRAADIGLVAKSSLYSPQMKHFKEGICWSSVDTTLYKPIDQGMVILEEGEKSSEVKDFYNFMQSIEAKNILRNYGYRVE